MFFLIFLFSVLVEVLENDNILGSKIFDIFYLSFLPLSSLNTIAFFSQLPNVTVHLIFLALLSQVL